MCMPALFAEGHLSTCTPQAPAAPLPGARRPRLLRIDGGQRHDPLPLDARRGPLAGRVRLAVAALAGLREKRRAAGVQRGVALLQARQHVQEARLLLGLRNSVVLLAAEQPV